jgi:hypothetical protein
MLVNILGQQLGDYGYNMFDFLLEMWSVVGYMLLRHINNDCS